MADYFGRFIGLIFVSVWLVGFLWMFVYGLDTGNFWLVGFALLIWVPAGMALGKD
jgi:hypothetical protein